MTNGTIINHIITDTIEERCKDAEVKLFIKNALKYELDVYNRYPRKEDIEGHYNLMVEKIIREK